MPGKFNKEAKTKADLIEAVAEMMVKSSEFRAQVSGLIALNTKIIKYDQIKQLAAGKSPYYNAISEGLIQAIVNGVSALGSGGLSIGAAVEARKASALNVEAIKAQAATQTKQATEATKQALLNAITAKTLNQSAVPKGPSQSVIIALIIVFVIGSIGLFYVLTRPKAAALAPAAPMPPKMENGGSTVTQIPDIEGLPSSSPAPTPAAPAPAPIDSVIQNSVV